MNYTASHAYEQLEFDFSAPSYLLIPSALPGFHNEDTKRYNSISGAVIYLMRGSQDILPEDAVCASCGAAMHVHSNREIVLSHLRFGKALTQISVTRKRFFCPSCAHPTCSTSLIAQIITASRKSWRLTSATCLPSAHIPTSKWPSFVVCTSIQ